MATWQEFAEANPELAAHGKRMLGLGKEYGSFEGGDRSHRASLYTQ